MASDLLLGFILGIAVIGFFNPYHGIFWIIREQRKQIAFLKGPMEDSEPVENNRHDDR